MEKAAARQQVPSSFPSQREVEQRGASFTPSHARESSLASPELGAQILLHREHGGTRAGGMRRGMKPHPAEDEAAPQHMGRRKAGSREETHSTMGEHQQSENRSWRLTKGPISRPPANKQPLSPTSSNIAQEIKGPQNWRDQPKSCTPI